MVLVFITLAFSFLYYLMYRDLNRVISEMSEEKSLLSQKNELLKNAWFETLLSTGVDMNKDLTLLNDEGSFLLKDIVVDNVLIVRLSYAACQPCLFVQ